MLTLKKLKTTYVMRNLQSFVIKEDIFRYHRQKMLLRGGTKHGDYGFVEWRFFWWWSLSVHVHLKVLPIYFLHVIVVSILIFQKMTNKYNETFNKKIYTLISKNVVQNFVRLARHFFPEMSTFRNNEKYGPLLPKKQTDYLVVSCDFLIDS